MKLLKELEKEMWRTGWAYMRVGYNDTHVEDGLQLDISNVPYEDGGYDFENGGQVECFGGDLEWCLKSALEYLKAKPEVK